MVAAADMASQPVPYKSSASARRWPLSHRPRETDHTPDSPFINASGVELSSMLWIMMGVLAAAVASFPVAYRAARGSGAPL